MRFFRQTFHRQKGRNRPFRGPLCWIQPFRDRPVTPRALLLALPLLASAAQEPAAPDPGPDPQVLLEEVRRAYAGCKRYVDRGVTETFKFRSWTLDELTYYHQDLFQSAFERGRGFRIRSWPGFGGWRACETVWRDGSLFGVVPFAFSFRVPYEGSELDQFVWEARSSAGEVWGLVFELLDRELRGRYVRDWTREGRSWTHCGMEQVRDERCHVLRGSREGDPRVMVFWIGEEDFLLRKVFRFQIGPYGLGMQSANVIHLDPRVDIEAAGLPDEFEPEAVPAEVGTELLQWAERLREEAGLPQSE